MPETRKPWSTHEDYALHRIVQQYGTNSWSSVSQAMFDYYNLQNRTGKQCRQRWHNHLDPQISKKSWSAQEEQIIFTAHRMMGSKWTEISKLIQGRTDNAIKNHFYSTIRRSLRRINKILGAKNSTDYMRTIKPVVLSEIFNHFGNQTQKYSEIIGILIEFSRSHRKKDIHLTKQKKELLQFLMDKVVELNNHYLIQEDKLQKQNQPIPQQINNENMCCFYERIVPNTAIQYDWEAFHARSQLVKLFLLKKEQNQTEIENKQQLI